MSVIVKSMDLPMNCAECRMWCICECLNDFEDFESVCYAVEDGDLIRDKNCPLVEIPTPHGRLIDADKFKADHSMKNDCAECEKELRYSSRSCEYDRIYSKMDFCGWLDDAEVVIEAEGRE